MAGRRPSTGWRDIATILLYHWFCTTLTSFEEITVVCNPWFITVCLSKTNKRAKTLDILILVHQRPKNHPFKFIHVLYINTKGYGVCWDNSDCSLTLIITEFDTYIPLPKTCDGPVERKYPLEYDYVFFSFDLSKP